MKRREYFDDSYHRPNKFKQVVINFMITIIVFIILFLVASKVYAETENSTSLGIINSMVAPVVDNKKN